MFSSRKRKKSKAQSQNQGAFIQPKLKRGKAGDKYEVEADKKADEVVNADQKSQDPKGQKVIDGTRGLGSDVSPFVQSKEEEPTQSKEEEAQSKEEEAQAKEEEAQSKEEETQSKEEETQSKNEEKKRKEAQSKSIPNAQKTVTNKEDRVSDRLRSGKKREANGRGYASRNGTPFRGRFW